MTDPRTPQAIAALIRMVVGGSPSCDDPQRILVDHQVIVEVRAAVLEDYTGRPAE